MPSSTPQRIHLHRAFEDLHQGLRLCLEVVRGAWRHPTLGPRLLRVVLFQAAAVALVAVALVALGVGWHGRASSTGVAQLDRAVSVVAGVYGILLVVQWGVVALSHEFHDALTREAFLWAGLVPEDPDRRPRVRIDLSWLTRRLKRRVRGSFVLLPGFALIAAFGAVAPGGKPLSAILSSLWIAHWWVVFSLAKSARAWPEPVASEPWFLRGADALVRAIPPLGVGPLRWWRRFAAWTSSSVWSPIAWTERRGWQGAGVGVLRLAAAVPLLGLALRPLVPLCAALVIERGALARAQLPRAGVAQDRASAAA